MNKPAILLFVHFAASGAPTNDYAVIVGASAIALGVKPKSYLGLVGMAAISKVFAGGEYAAISEVANNCAIGGLIASAFYLIYSASNDE